MSQAFDVKKRGFLQPLDRQIMALAVPAFGALVAEPLFLLADSAMVGHLGGSALAGLGLAAAVLQTIVGLMVFLAYGTTPAVARRLGRGEIDRAIGVGMDSLWTALGLGLVLAFAGFAAAPWLVGLFSATADVAAQAETYLRLSMPGIPALLLVFAASGLLRGLQDTRTPLWVASVGFGANILLNYLLMYVFRLGIAGAAIGSVLAQWGMVAAYVFVIARHVQKHRARWWPHWGGIKMGAADGGWLFVRTLTLRAAMLLAVYVATLLGPVELAAFHVTMTLFATVAFALDALAIAAQALIGHRLGQGDSAQARAILRRCLAWGVGCGVVLGIVIIAGSSLIGPLFSSNETVRAVLPPALVILGLSVPLGAIVWVLDGVLIGAGDMRYLGLAGVFNLAVFVPLAGLVGLYAPGGAGGLAWLMAAFAFGFLGARLVSLGWRARSDAWMVVGVAQSDR
ncbi:MAG TPA: MATE family efflux transporter [Burkholderiaceae bacterium]|nr:MATE family efflux transporter [Burkholderiaceae bacterium]